MTFLGPQIPFQNFAAPNYFQFEVKIVRFEIQTVKPRPHLIITGGAVHILNVDIFSPVSVSASFQTIK